MTLLAALIILGGMVCMAVDGDTALVAMPEPAPPTDAAEGEALAQVKDEHEPAALFPAGLAVLSR